MLHLSTPSSKLKSRDQKINEASLVQTDAACLHEIPITTMVSGYLDDDKCTNEKDVTWKSIICDGVEVEFSDVTRLQDNTTPLPKPQFGISLQDCSVNVTTLSDFDQQHQAEHTDHLLCSHENDVPVIATLPEGPNGREKLVNAPSDVTFKSFNCTGGEIEILDATNPSDETIPLSANHSGTCSQSCGHNVDPSILAGDHDLPDGEDHLDHAYCNPDKCLTASDGNFSTSPETFPYRFEAVDEVEQICSVVPDSQTDIQTGDTCDSFNQAAGEDEKSEGINLSEKTAPISEGLAVVFNDGAVRHEHVQDEYEQPSCQVGSGHAVVDTPLSSPTNTSFKTSNNESINCNVQETSKHSLHLEDSVFSLVLHQKKSFVCSQSVASKVDPTPVEVLLDLPTGDSSSGPPESSEGKDSALGSSNNGPVLNNSAEKHAETLTDVLKVLSVCPSVASAFQFGILSPVTGRASLSTQRINRDPTLEQFVGYDSALEIEKSLLAPVNLNPAGLWAEHLESPMPHPLFNSTALGYKLQSGPVAEPDEDVGVKPSVMPQSKVERAVLDTPVIQDGPLQQQLRQMAEFLMLASGKMGPTAVSSSAPLPNTVVPSTRATPVETHSVCVGTTAVQMVDHSLNTSGQFERKRDFSVADSCTITDPLLWK